MSARAAVLSRLSHKIGFPFSESELSPAARRKIGELEIIKSQIESTLTTIKFRQDQLVQIEAEKNKVTNVLFRGRQIQVQIQDINNKIGDLNTHLSKLYSTLDSKVETLSDEIFTELSASHQTKTPLSSASPQFQTVKETIREIVMIPCVYCKSLMPQTSTTCPACGAQRRG